MTQTTPGPWGLMSGMPTNVLGNGGIRVARCDFDGDFGHPECAANARLIAAAPDLLEAVKEFCRRVEAGEVRSIKSYAIFKAAIAKAEGHS